MVRLIYDCVKAPYDIANILQVALALGECELYFTGNSLRHDHPKIVSKLRSWSSKIRLQGLTGLNVHYYQSFEALVVQLKKQKIYLIGTSPNAKKSFYEMDLSKNDFAIVFGTEVGGLSKSKIANMDEIVKIPMLPEIDFMTLSIVTPIIAYEVSRQQGIFK